MPPIYLLIKPASSLCNLRCDYCFYHDIAKNRECKSFGIMALETLERLIRRALEEGDSECTFAYQGGEPTLAGLDFYRKSIELQKRYNKRGLKINNLIQTNACHLDEDWAKFFSEHHFLVGVSLDGTKDTHDRFRKTASGEGSFKLVMKGIELLKKYQVEFNILTVVNGETVKHIGKIYRFYKKQNFDFLQFIPCIPPFKKEGSPSAFTLGPEAYGNFMCQLFDLWYEDIRIGCAPHIRQFENYIEMLMGYPPESCGMSGICSNQMVVEADGSVYPCDFYVLDQYKLGTIQNNSLAEIAERQKESSFVPESIQPHLKCNACRYFPICRGGCKRYREPKVGNEFGLNFLCRGYYQFFDYSYSRLLQLSRILNPACK